MPKIYDLKEHLSRPLLMDFIGFSIENKAINSEIL